MPKFKCPECGEELNHIYYREDGTQYGTASLTPYGDSVDVDDYEFESFDGCEMYFTCPECNEDINLADIEIVEDNDEEEEEEAPNLLEILRSHNTPQSMPTNGVSDKFVFCKKCHELFEEEDLKNGVCEACRT